MAEEKVKKVEKEEKSSLTDFAWDEEDVFFGKVEDESGDYVDVETIEKKEETKTEEKPEEKVEEEPEEKEEKPKEKEEEKEEEKVEFFKEEPEETEEEKASAEKEFFNVLATELKESGIYQHVEIPEEEMTQEDFIDLQDKEVNARVEETFEAFFEELDEDGKAFLKFKKDGGNTADFFQAVRSEGSLPKGEIGDENYDKAITKYYLREFEGLDDDEIDDRLDWLEEGEKLTRFAKKYDEKVKNHIKKEKEILLDKQKKREQERERIDREFHDTLKKTLEENDEIKSFPISPKEKNELFAFITKPSVKIGKNKYITQFQKAIQDVTNDYSKLVLLAKLVKNDFDISDIESKVETKKTRNIKKNIQNAKTNQKPKTTGSSGIKKSLTDYFD